MSDRIWKECPDFIVCQSCRNSVAIVGDAVSCTKCDWSQRTEDGVLDLRGDIDYCYDYEFDIETTRALASMARELGWKQALMTAENRFGEEWQEYFLIYNSSPDRAVWIDQVILSNDDVVLDFGCGTGAISAICAPRCRAVISVDYSIDRLRFWNVRATQEGLQNVLPVAWGGTGICPFREKSFDVVLLNGVLEWVPEAIRSGDPEAVQRNTLKMLSRLLRPGGRLLLSIENRYALQYFLGVPDHHSELRFATILPRRLADVYSRLVNRRAYRVYTHSLRKYREMLSAAGLRRIRTFEAFPMYQFPEQLIDIDDEAELRRVRSGRREIEHLILSALTFLRIAKYLVFTYTLIGVKEGHADRE